MSQKSILGGIPESSHALEQGGTDPLRSNIRERNEQLLSLAREAVDVCLSEQRKVLAQESRVQKFRQLNPHTQYEYMETKPARLFYYLERAFSLPSDYYEFVGKISYNGEKELINSLVLDPESFIDDFLTRLGICDPYNLHRKLLHKKLEQRIEAIPRIKEMFAHAERLPFSEHGKTARLLSFNQPGKPWHGKYLLFQERTGMIEVDGKRKKIIKIVPHVFDNIFSLARSQEKAIKGMSRRSKEIESLKQDIDTLLLTWYGSTNDERREEIDKIRKELQGKQTFHEISALRGRIEKIDFVNSQISTRRLIGAWNDLMHGYSEKIEKTAAISEQTAMIRSMIGREMRRFGIVHEKFLDLCKSLDHADIVKSLRKGEEEEGVRLLPTVREQFLAILPLLDEYIKFHWREPFIGAPFSQIRGPIEFVYKRLREEKENDTIIVRIVFITTLFLRLEHIRLGFYDVKDRIKSSQTPLSEEETRLLWEEIDAFLKDIEEMSVLMISVDREIDLKFIGYGMALRAVKWALEKADIKEVLKQIDTIIVPIL